MQGSVTVKKSDFDDIGAYLRNVGRITLFSRKNEEEERAGIELSAARADLLESVMSYAPHKSDAYFQAHASLIEHISLAPRSRNQCRERLEEKKTLLEYIAGYIAGYGSWPGQNELLKFKFGIRERRLISYLRLSDLQAEIKLWRHLERANIEKNIDPSAARKKVCDLPTPIFSRILREFSKPQLRKYWQARIFDAVSGVPELPVSIARPLYNMVEIEKKFIEANLRWVIANAKKFFHRCQVSKVDYSDIIQEGNLGLHRAIRRFDPSKGFRFSTFSTWWIVQGIQRTFDNNANTIRIPVHVIEKYRKIEAAMQHLTHELHREPTVEEIIKRLPGLALTPERVQKIQSIARGVDSLDRQINFREEAQDSTLGDLVEDARAVSPEQNSLGKSLEDAIDDIFEKALTEQERRVMNLRFGRKGNHKHTFEEAGAKLMVTRQRIQQLEVRAMAKLRRPKYMDALSKFMFLNKIL